MVSILRFVGFRKNESFDEPDEFLNDPIEVVKTTRVVKEWVAKSDQYNFDPVLLKEQKAKLQKYLKKLIVFWIY